MHISVQLWSEKQLINLDLRQFQKYVGIYQRWKKPNLLASGRPAQLPSRGKFSRSRGKFLRSQVITLLIRQHITFFEPLVQPFEHFKHSNTA